MYIIMRFDIILNEGKYKKFHAIWQQAILYICITTNLFCLRL
jgi:hypothetical protein